MNWMEVEMEANPDADVLYSDEDKIDDGERLFAPLFKPDWSPELFLSQNLINHLGVYRPSLVEPVGRFRLGFQGTQDYDLALRVTQFSAPHRILPVPVVLSPWLTFKWLISPGCYATASPHQTSRP